MKNSQVGTENATPTRTDDHGLSLFLDMITHDDRNSFYHIAGFSQGGKCHTFSRGVKHLKEFSFDPGYDWYITRNGFSSRKVRNGSTCRQLNSFLFDVDVHGGGDPAYGVALTLEAIDAAIESDILPEPTMIVSTGRGLHLYYALDRSTSAFKRGGKPNDAGTRYYSDIYRKLAHAIKPHISSVPGAMLDTSVFDDARISRVPGTINSKTGTVCEVVRYSGTYYTLSAIKSGLPKATPPKNAGGKGRRAGCRRRGRYTALAKARMAKIEELQAYRSFDCRGTRELMCFLFYNSAVQVFEEESDAYEAMVKLNERFASPIDDKELAGIQRSVGRVGYYRMTSKRISELLGLTVEEAESTGFFTTRREHDRQKAKEATAAKRNKRNRRIAFLRRMNLKKSEIASIIGCCERTIHNVKESKEQHTIGLDEATELILAARRSPADRTRITTINKTVANFLHGEPPEIREITLDRRGDGLDLGEHDPGGT